MASVKGNDLQLLWHYLSHCRRCLFCKLAILSFTGILLNVAGCASVDQQLHSAEYQRHYQVVTANTHDTLPTTDALLVAALAFFERLDEIPNQWHSHFRLSNVHLSRGDTPKALFHAKQAYNLAKHEDTTAFLFSTSLQLVQLTGEKELYQRALALPAAA